MTRDSVPEEIAQYAAADIAFSREAIAAARLDLLDALGCAMAGLRFPACRARLGPLVPGVHVDGGARVPGTPLELDPMEAAFAIASTIRWLDFNDAWLAAEWGHPSDNIGAILAVADWVSRRGAPLPMRRVLEAIVKAHEIQGVLALDTGLNRRGIDHTLYVEIASAAVATWLLGGDADAAFSAVTNALVDAGPLRVYRQGENTGPRKSWAAADAAARGVRLAMMALRGEPGYATVLTAPTYGFDAVVLGARPLRLVRPLGSYVVENVLFKVRYPAEFHAQTAVECALQLRPHVAERLGDIAEIQVWTHESALRIIDKRGPLRNPAARDHCLQYMVAVALLHGDLRAEDYEDEAAADPRIEDFRRRISLFEDPGYSRDYLDPERRSAASAMVIRLADGTETERAEVEYPLGHPRRRAEARPLLEAKFRANMRGRFSDGEIATLVRLLLEGDSLESEPVPRFMERLRRASCEEEMRP